MDENTRSTPMLPPELLNEVACILALPSNERDATVRKRNVQSVMDSSKALREACNRLISMLVMKLPSDLLYFPKHAVLRRLDVSGMSHEIVTTFFQSVLGSGGVRLQHVEELTVPTSSLMDGDYFRTLVRVCTSVRKLTVSCPSTLVLGLQISAPSTSFFEAFRTNNQIKSLGLYRATPDDIRCLLHVEELDDVPLSDESLDAMLSLPSLQIYRYYGGFHNHLTRPATENKNKNKRVDKVTFKVHDIGYMDLLHLLSSNVWVDNTLLEVWESDRSWFVWDELKTTQQLADLSRALVAVQSVPKMTLSKNSYPVPELYESLKSLREGGWNREIFIYIEDSSQEVCEAVASIAKALPDCIEIGFTCEDTDPSALLRLRDFKSLNHLRIHPGLTETFDASLWAALLHIDNLETLTISMYDKEMDEHPWLTLSSHPRLRRISVDTSSLKGVKLFASLCKRDTVLEIHKSSRPVRLNDDQVAAWLSSNLAALAAARDACRVGGSNNEFKVTIIEM